MLTENKKKELAKQLQELNNKRAEFSETELLALSLKKISDAGIPLEIVLEYFKSLQEIAWEQNSDIKTVSENFMRRSEHILKKDILIKKSKRKKKN